jgi:TraM recognition site of TraD and TraG
MREGYVMRKSLIPSFSRSSLQGDKVLLCIVVVSFVAIALLLAVVPALAASQFAILLLGVLPCALTIRLLGIYSDRFAIERARRHECRLRGGVPVVGMPPQRDTYAKALQSAEQKGEKILNRYLIGFEVDTGEGLWITDDEICNHAAVFAKTGVGKTLWLESLLFQQMLRGRASGATFIDAKRDLATLAQVIYMAQVTGRIEDLIVIDPLSPLHSYNFVLTPQRPDVKARKVLRAALPAASDSSTTKHYDRLASDSVYRVVRALESLGLAWSLEDVAVALGSFALAYPHLCELLQEKGDREALLELGQLATSYRTGKGTLDAQKLTDNLRGIASELHSIAQGEGGDMFCARNTDLNLTDAILSGKIVYFMLPRLEESEGAQRMLKVFREDLEVSIGEITSSRTMRLEDPHLIIVDEGASTFSASWANLFELARKGRFSLIFGAQSAGGLSDHATGLSESFYERVMANVSLKVIMRVGDNKTATELSQWMGKITKTQTTVSKSTSSGHSGTVLSPLVDAASRRMSGTTSTVSTEEVTGDFVTPDELKHGLSSEKGLAWVDLAGKRRVKMRALWVDFSLPDSWDGRHLIPPLEVSEKDALNLKGLVDKDIFESEHRSYSQSSGLLEARRVHARIDNVSSQPLSSPTPLIPQDTFKINTEERHQRFGNITAIPSEVVKTEDEPPSVRFALKPRGRK